MSAPGALVPRRTPHRWRFFRAGGFDQVHLASSGDLLALDQLDQKLWAALACPTRSIHADARTLEQLDGDRDQRIRAPDLIAACQWIGSLLRDPEQLLLGSSELPLESLRTDVPEAQQLREAAAAVLKDQGDLTGRAISVAQASQALVAFDASPLNGDGVLPPEACPTPELRQTAADVLACLGGVPDLSGKPGVTREKLEAFFAELRAHRSWSEQPSQRAELAPLGERTPEAFAAFAPLAPKLGDYFIRCRLATYDPGAAAALNADAQSYQALGGCSLEATSSALLSLPLARIAPGRSLPLSDGLNPAFAKAMHDFKTRAVEPLLGTKDALTEADWQVLEAKFLPYAQWQQDKRGAAVEGLGRERMAALLEGTSQAELEALFEQDKARAPIRQSLVSLERLVLLHRDLYSLANNFVSFRDFYARTGKAIFQAGTLFLDQRSCELCLQVSDTAQHAAMAGLSRAYVVYCDCRRGAEKMTIAAAVTAGDSDNVAVGRNGVFYDRQGRDWDATVTRIVDNPISIRQAFWSPYKKLVRFIEEQVAKRAGEGEASAHTKLTSTVSGNAVPSPVAAPSSSKLDVGIIAALGVAVGGLAAAFGAVLETLFGLGFLMPLGVVALVLSISTPSMVLAWLKLRQRNLAPLLDANGWAVNIPAKINLPFGGSLTQIARLPKGATRSLSDPFAERRAGRWALVTLAIATVLALMWAAGTLDSVLPVRWRHSTFFPPPPARAVVTPPAP